MCQLNALKIHRKCKTPEEPISVTIMWKGEPVELCRSCWERIPPDLEWGTETKLTIEESLGRRVKEEAEATLTEYRLKDSKKLTVQNEEKNEDSEWSEN